MLVFNEGLPRAGKSYDAVANHIIPAIKSGRHVFARLNGLNPYAIAQVSGVPEDEVRRLLHHVEPSQVTEIFRIQVDDEKRPHLIEPLKRDALFVVDECHEFWASSRADLHPLIENFFAYHGQFGMDGVLISQWYKRLHDAVRGRVERKHLFRKLNFLQKFRNRKGKNDDPAKRYVCRMSIAMEPDKFAVMTSTQHDYRPEIFPCYRSFQPGAANVEAYDPGFGGIFTRNQKVVYFGLIAMCLAGGVYAYSFVAGAKEKARLEREERESKKVAESQPLAGTQPAQFYQPDIEPVSTPTLQVDGNTPPPGTVAASTGIPAPLAPATAVDAKHGPRVGYFFGLAKSGRTRLAAVVTPPTGGRPFGIIEWRIGNDQVLDRIDTRDLERLGFEIELDDKFASITANGETLFATMYPLDSRYEAPTGRGGMGQGVTVTSGGYEASSGPAASGTAAGQSSPGDWGIASYGDFGQQTGRYVGQGISR